MEKRDRGFKVIAVVALVVAVVGLSIAYAGYTSTLTVEGTATVASAWKIVWDDLDNGTASGYADLTGKTLAIDSSKQAISGVIGTLKAPGDSIVYTWNVENQGDIDATLAGVTLGQLSCAPATGSNATQAQATAVCADLTIAFTYDGQALTASTTGDLLHNATHNSSKPVTMTLTYNASSSGVELDGDVTVTLSTTSFTYNQKNA